MFKLVFFLYIIPLVFSGAATRCYRFTYREIYYDAKLTMENTNNICNSIVNSTSITNYYCSDQILKNGLEQFPIPSEGCESWKTKNQIRNQRINYEFLNEIICQEIKYNNLTVNPPNSILDYCMSFPSSSANNTSYFLLIFLSILMVFFNY